jgi:hypothetical protein
VDFTSACREHDVARVQSGSACRIEVGQILLDYVDRSVEPPCARGQRFLKQWQRQRRE